MEKSVLDSCRSNVQVRIPARPFDEVLAKLQLLPQVRTASVERFRLEKKLSYLVQNVKRGVFLGGCLQNNGPPSTPQARLELLEAGPERYFRDRRCAGKVLENGTAVELDSKAAFLAFADELDNQLARMWKDDQRTAVIRTVIQVAELLEDPGRVSAQFYPAMFFLLSDLVTYFGQLIHDRLLAVSPDLRVGFTFSDVGQQTRELCKNWMHKITSVRGMLGLQIIAGAPAGAEPGIECVLLPQNWCPGSSWRQRS